MADHKRTDRFEHRLGDLGIKKSAAYTRYVSIFLIPRSPKMCQICLYEDYAEVVELVDTPS